MSEKKDQRHFHPVYSLKFIQKTLLIYLLPLLQALIAWDLAALRTALRQDAALFAVLALFSVLEWRFSRWHLAGGTLHVRSGILLRRHRLITGAELAAVRLERPLLYRLVDASALTLYPSRAGTKPLTLYLKKKDAAALAAALLPLSPQSEYRPAGAERLALTLLSASTTATGLLLAAAMQRSEGFGQWVETYTLEQLRRATALAPRWLPAGAAWLLAAAGVLLSISLLRSAFHTARYRVYSGADTLSAEGGLLHYSQTRIRRSALLWADVRITPVARLLCRRPVYLAAGSWDGGEIPFAVLRSGELHALEALVPGFVPAPRVAADTRGRSKAYFALGGGLLALFLVLAVLSARQMPGMTSLLLLPALAALGLVLVSLEGYHTEGATLCAGRLTARYVKWYTVHCISFLQPPVLLCEMQNPWAMAAGRTNLELRLPARMRVLLRSVPLRQAAAVRAWMRGQTSGKAAAE